MKCEKKYNYFDYIEGKYSDIEMIEFENHLKYCLKCQKNLEMVKQFIFHIETQKKQHTPILNVEYLFDILSKKEKVALYYGKLQPALFISIAVLSLILGFILGDYYYHNITKVQTNAYYMLNDIQHEFIEIALLNP